MCGGQFVYKTENIPPFGRNPESAAAEFLLAGDVGVTVRNTKTG